MKSYMMLISGVIVMVIALWGGTYVVFDAIDLWYGFPAFLTAALSFAGGAALFAAGLSDIVCPERGENQ